MSPSNRYLRLTALGQRAYAASRLHRSLRLFEAAEDEARRHGDRELADRAFCNRCVVLVELDRLDGAVSELKHVLMRSSDPFTAWMAAYYTAQAYEAEENVGRALAYARRASDLASASGDARALAASANQHGVLALKDSHFSEASERFRAALSLAAGGDGIATAIIQDNLGYCLMCVGSAAEGLELCRQAHAALETAGTRHLLAEISQDLCYGELQEGHLEQAAAFGERALTLAREFGLDGIERNTLMLLADAAMDAGEDEKADAYLDRLAAHYPDLRGMKSFMQAFNVREVINLKV